MHLDDITGLIVDSAVKLHKRLGPGLLESVYRDILAKNLERRGLSVEKEVKVSFDYDGMHFDDGLRLDLLVNSEVVVELKSVEQLARVHWKQVLTYLRLLDLPVGFLINFGGPTLKSGLQRVVNNHLASPRVREMIQAGEGELISRRDAETCRMRLED